MHLPSSLRISSRQHLDTHRAASKMILSRWQAAIDKGDNRPWLASSMRFHTAKRDKLVRLLRQSPRHKELLERIEYCGCQVNAYQDSCGEFLVTANSCKSRFCPRCAQGACRRSIQRTIERLPAFDLPRSFLTLSQPQHPHTSLATGIRAIRRAFTYLRESPLWIQCVRGGAYVIELTASKTYEHTFHVHMHVIIETTWIDMGELEREWSAAVNKAHRIEYHTTDTMRVNRPDLRKCENDQATVAYISAYLSRTIPDELYDEPVLMLDAIDSLGQHKRMSSLFGSWATRKDKKKAAPKGDSCGSPMFQLEFSLVHAHQSALRGDRLCIQLMTKIGLNYTKAQTEMDFLQPTPTPQPPQHHPPPTLYETVAA